MPFPPMQPPPMQPSPLQSPRPLQARREPPCARRAHCPSRRLQGAEAQRVLRRGILRGALLWAALSSALYSLSAGPVAAGPLAVSVRNPWIRMLPAGLPASGYMRLDNHTGQPLALVRADSPAHYSSVALHRTLKKGGITTMEEVERIAIPPHGSVRLLPGGYHLMLLNAKQPIKPGQRIPVTLRFSDGSDLTAEFLVHRSSDTGTTPPRHAPMRARPADPAHD